MLEFLHAAVPFALMRASSSEAHRLRQSMHVSDKRLRDIKLTLWRST
ncbi:hypothetical protein SAMN02787142_5123 [Burkholderia sp. WP9]|nr:hypothetical protein SAMN02787142_5123 [Burkholderia sp. WP9]